MTVTAVGRSGLVVARLPAVREVQIALRTKVFFFMKNTDTQFWARAAHLLQCLGRLSLPPFEGR